ncbi:MAG: cadherin repeat domain-containing protein [Nitrospira sp.]|nr:cadherin repeat domain-containing protein [Nitrospira sp.]
MPTSSQDCSTDLVTTILDGPRPGTATTRVDKKNVLITGPASFTVVNNASNGAAVGTMTADANAARVFSITAGNAQGVFTINASSGAITVLSNTNLGIAGTIHRLTVRYSLTNDTAFDETVAVVTVT